MKNKEKDCLMLNTYAGICDSIGDKKRAEELKALIGDEYKAVIV